MEENKITTYKTEMAGQEFTCTITTDTKYPETFADIDKRLKKLINEKHLVSESLQDLLNDISEVIFDAHCQDADEFEQKLLRREHNTRIRQEKISAQKFRKKFVFQLVAATNKSQDHTLIVTQILEQIFKYLDTKNTQIINQFDFETQINIKEGYELIHILQKQINFFNNIEEVATFALYKNQENQKQYNLTHKNSFEK